MHEQQSIKTLLHSAEQRLTLSGSARLDAEILLQTILDCDRSYLFAHPERILNNREVENFETHLQQRLQGKPIAYITGIQSFWDIDLKVNEHCLIPRADTETLIEKALEIIPKDAAWNIADLGTGSGAIAIVLAKERPRCRLLATDIDLNTLQLAQENAERHAINSIEFLHSHWLNEIPQQTFNMIISNPPYIETGDEHLQGVGVRFEPSKALSSGVDGLDAIREITGQCHDFLTQNGFLLLEHGYNQGMKVMNILHSNAFHTVEALHDLSGHHRGTVARYSA